MDVLVLKNLELIYKMENKTVKEKVDETVADYPQLSPFYLDDLKVLYTEPLPFIEGLEITTQFGDSGGRYVMITKMPESISPEVQKALMRIGGCLGGFTVEQWGIGFPKTEAMEKRIQEYAEQYYNEQHHSLEYISGEKAGYPKVFQVWHDKVAGAPNESWEICKLVGIVLD